MYKTLDTRTSLVAPPPIRVDAEHRALQSFKVISENAARFGISAFAEGFSEAASSTGIAWMVRMLDMRGSIV